VYELAQFLDHTATHDSLWRDSLWKDWRDARPSPLAETIACHSLITAFCIHCGSREFGTSDH